MEDFQLVLASLHVASVLQLLYIIVLMAEHKRGPTSCLKVRESPVPLCSYARVINTQIATHKSTVTACMPV